MALVDGDTTIGYAELDARADRLAHRLRAHGVGPGTLVGLSMERSAALVTGLLAVLKAGGAYVPLDPAYPVERLRHMVEDSGLRTILTGGAVPRWWEGFDGDVLDAEDTAGDGPAGPPSGGAGPDDLAYVIYTSGSTGRPKGVLIPHRNISRIVHLHRPLVRVRRAGRVDAVPQLRLRLLGLGAVGSARPRRPASSSCRTRRAVNRRRSCGCCASSGSRCSTRRPPPSTS